MRTQLQKQIIQFKSDVDYYHIEQSGEKNNTIREIDWEDERFAMLLLMKTMRAYGVIRIVSTEVCQGICPSFKKRIKNVCIWDKYMIITWEL